MDTAVSSRALRRGGAIILAAALAACTPSDPAPVIEALPPITGNAAATPRVNGVVGAPNQPGPAQVVYGQNQNVTVRTRPGAPPGDVSLDFADTDLREVVAQILGTQLRVNYTIDPGVRGAVTLHTTVPLSAAQLLPVLQTLLAQNGATLQQSDGLYRVVAGAAAPGGPPGAPPGIAGPAGGPNTLAGNDAVSGGSVMPLRFASAEELARVLQPFVSNGARITPDPSRNALLISGDPAVRATLTDLVQAFDIDLLAGQSYALLPTTPGDTKDFASALADAFRAQQGGALAGVVRVVPMARINAVLVISNQPRFIDDARRVFAIIERNRRETVRTWHVYYLQNSNSNDAAHVLQQAFTPNAVTAQATVPGQTAPGSGSQQISGGGRSQMGGPSQTGGPSGQNGIAQGGNGLGGSGLGGLGGSSQPGGPGQAQGGLGQGGGPSSVPGGPANPLLGGLDPGAGSQGGGDAEALRIVPNPQNNALLIYATQRENDTVEAMLRKMDILPLQVRIDATIAEVTLNDQLQYGTQFFFKSGGINGVLSNIVQNPVSTALGASTLGTTLPGFVIGGNGIGGAPAAISALQAVTSVQVLSSPQLLVQDNHPARLQVGSLVPYLTSSSQSQLVPNATVVNQVSYQATGVIMEVTPRVNSGGLVTLDIYQEVSDVDNSSARASGIDSPTFLERNVTSRVVVQDGQTVGLAGLIRDSSTRSNQGIPWLKDIPLLGLLAGSQANTRARTELLVLITPHVVHDQRDARALTEDLRDQLVNAAAVPTALRDARQTGRTDPGRPVRRALQLEH